MTRKRTGGGRRRSAAQISLGRAARLHRLVTTLARGPARREDLLASLAIGLRTFYRELQLLKRCGIKIQTAQKSYNLRTTVAEAGGRLPFPDPQLSFAEMAELSVGPGPAARRLAELLASVVGRDEPQPERTPAPKPRRPRAPKADAES